MLDAANSGKITFERAVELCSTNVAKIFGCDNKGAIAVGKDADMHSDYDHTIWEGKKLHGYPVQTYLRGKLVYDNGDFVGTPGMGDYVKRSHR
jgi:dihydropyrimidinase